MRLLGITILCTGISTTIAQVTADGKCIPAAGSWTNYGPSNIANSITWLKTLTLTAFHMQSSSPPVALPTTGAALTAAINNAEGANALRDTAATPADALNAYVTNAATNYADCAICMIAYVKDVTEMYTNKTLPVKCQSKLQADFTLDFCGYALAPAILKFNSCTGSVLADLGSTLTVLSTTGGRCTPEQIMQLDGRFNLYETLMNKILYGTVTTDFDAAYQALPCRAVFDNWMTGITTTERATARGTSVCGTVPSGSQLFDNACGTTANTAAGGTLNAYFTTLKNRLGGGFTFQAPDAANTRCTSDEQAILSKIGSFEAIMKCSIAGDVSAGAPAPATWSSCVSNYWSPLGASLVGGSAFKCAVCFNSATGFGKKVNANFGAGAGKSLPDCTATGVFSTFCANELQSTGVLSSLYQCSGVRLSASQPTCTTAQIEKISPMVTSVIPFIIVARRIYADTTLDTDTKRMAAAVRGIADLPGFSSVNSTLPCASCFGGIVAGLASKMSADVNFRTACVDEYSAGCLGFDYVATVISDFNDCSGIIMKKETAYKCDATQYNLIVNNNIVSNLFSSAVSVGANATIASVMIKVLADVQALETKNNVVLPCANCIRDMVTGFFGLSDTSKATCKSSPSLCVTLLEVQPIISKFMACTGQSFNATALAATITPITPTPNVPGSNTTNTTNAVSRSAFSVFTVFGVLISALVL